MKRATHLEFNPVMQNVFAFNLWHWIRRTSLMILTYPDSGYIL